MSVPPGERLPASRVASHLAVMAIVAAVMGVVVAGLAIPFAGVLGIGAKSLSHTVDDLPAKLEAEPLAQQTTIVDIPACLGEPLLVCIERRDGLRG